MESFQSRRQLKKRTGISRLWSSLNSVQREREREGEKGRRKSSVCVFIQLQRLSLEDVSSVLKNVLWVNVTPREIFFFFLPIFNNVFHNQTDFLRLTCELFFKALICVWTFFFFFIILLLLFWYSSDAYQNIDFVNIFTSQPPFSSSSVGFYYSQPVFVIFFPSEEDGPISPTSVRVRVCWSVYVFDLVQTHNINNNNKKLYPRTANRVR